MNDFIKKLQSDKALADEFKAMEIINKSAK